MTISTDDKTYLRLRTRYQNLRRAIDQSPNPPTWVDREESEAWNEWVEWVEENDLNYTKFDPRGPQDEMVSVFEWVH